MSDTKELNCKGCGREAHPAYLERYGSYCLDCSNQGVPERDQQLSDAHAQNVALVSMLKEARQSLVFHIATLNLNGMTADEFSKFLEKHPNSRPRIIEQMDNVISQTPDAMRDAEAKRETVIQAAREFYQETGGILAAAMGRMFAQHETYWVQRLDNAQFKQSMLGDALKALEP